MVRITKKEAKQHLDAKIKHLKQQFQNGNYESLVIDSDDTQDEHKLILRHLAANIMRLNHQLGLQPMTKAEVDEYHKQLGEGFFSDLWNGIKSVGKTVFSVARPLVKPIGDIVGQKYGIPAGTIADEGLKTFGLGTNRARTTGGLYKSAGRYKVAGNLEEPGVLTGQRRLRPTDYS